MVSGLIFEGKGESQDKDPASKRDGVQSSHLSPDLMSSGIFISPVVKPYEVCAGSVLKLQIVFFFCGLCKINGYLSSSCLCFFLYSKVLLEDS